MPPSWLASSAAKETGSPLPNKVRSGREDVEMDDEKPKLQGGQGNKESQQARKDGDKVFGKDTENKGRSSGKAQRSKRGEEQLQGSEADLVMKCLLSMHDDVREIQSNLDYQVGVLAKTHRYAKIIDEELQAYRRLVQGLHEKAEEEEDWSNLGSSGPPSVRIFVRLLNEICANPVGEAEQEAKQTVAGVEESREEVRRRGAGPQHSRGGHVQDQQIAKTNIKVIMKTRIELDETVSLLFMMSGAGFKVHSGKVPREVLFLALQEVLTRRQQKYIWK